MIKSRVLSKFTGNITIKFSIPGRTFNELISKKETYLRMILKKVFPKKSNQKANQSKNPTQ
jgi:hypothetical protein